MIEWNIQHHRDLSTHDLYAILKLRSAVYVVEMGRPVIDTDGLDLTGDTHHVTGRHVSSDQSHISAEAEDQEKEFISYLRICVDREDNSVLIRRVAVAKSHRGQGLAKELMKVAIKWCEDQGFSKIRLPARTHLRKFCESLEFEVVSENYFIEGPDVWIVDMVKNITPLASKSDFSV